MKGFFTPLFLVLLCQSSMQDGHAMDDTAEAAKDRDWTFHAPSMNFFGSGEGGDVAMKTCEELKMRVEALEAASSAKAEKIHANCMNMQNLLSVMQPEITSSSAPDAPMPNPVSDAIGSDSGSDYLILFPITDGGAPLTDGTIPDGLNIDAAFPGSLGTDMNTAALSITDFNFFRIQMVRALRVLDQSIRDILDIPFDGCSDMEATTMTPGGMDPTTTM